MREIKFRAWDTIDNKMLFSEVWEEKRAIGFAYFDIGNSGYQPEDLKLMQYTGLKDETGKEIYEGDIIKARFDKQVIIGAVQFSRIGFICGSMGWIQKLLTATELIVIRNIYENPELLKDKPNG